jgi:hypothetical protein
VSAELAARLGFMATYDLQPDYYNSLLQQTAAVSTAQVKQLIQDRREEVEAIAEALIVRDELNNQDVEDILREINARRAWERAGAEHAGDNTLLRHLLMAESDEWREPVEPQPQPMPVPQPANVPGRQFRSRDAR